MCRLHDIPLAVGSRQAVRESVAQALGLGVFAHTNFVPDSRLVVLPIRDLALSTHLHVICLAERLSAPLIAGLLGVVEDLKRLVMQPTTMKSEQQYLLPDRRHFRRAAPLVTLALSGCRGFPAGCSISDADMHLPRHVGPFVGWLWSAGG